MTQAEFIAYTQIPPYPIYINIWYTNTAPYIVEGITVPTVDSQGQNIVALLDQIQQIIVPVQTITSTLDITLNILTRQLYSTPSGNYYFFTVQPYEIPSSVQDITGNDANISFTPAIDSNVFYDSPYNVTHGVVENTRKSLYIMLSDRYKVGTVGLPGYTGPTNINQILAGTATKADVQDSLYSDTGWINARYEGTEQIYTGANVSPAITGKPFSGAEYPISTSIDQINYQKSGSLVVYSDYFYTGIGDTPGFAANKVNYIQISGSLYTEDTPYLDIVGTSFGIDPIQYLPPIGSTVAINGGSDESLGNTYEVLYIQGISIITLTPEKVYRIKVVRKYNGTPDSIVTSGIVPNQPDSIYTITPSQIYKYQGNKLIGVNKSKLLVKETGAVLTLNSYGYVVGST